MTPGWAFRPSPDFEVGVQNMGMSVLMNTPQSIGASDQDPNQRQRLTKIPPLTFMISTEADQLVLNGILPPRLTPAVVPNAHVQRHVYFFDLLPAAGARIAACQVLVQTKAGLDLRGRPIS